MKTFQKLQLRYGLLTLSKKSIQSEDIITGWISCHGVDKVKFNSSYLINQQEVKNLRNGLIIGFNMKAANREFGYPYANLPRIIRSEELVENLLDISKDDLIFICSKADKKSSAMLTKKAEEILSEQPDGELTFKLQQVKAALDSIKGIDGFESDSPQRHHVHKSTLSLLLSSNDSAYQSTLFKLLLQGLGKIDDSNSYLTAKDLWSFNSILNIIEKDRLGHDYYQKANHTYKLRLWIDGYIDYCDPRELRRAMQNSNELYKERIIKRLSAPGLISEMVNTSITKAFFKGIRAILIQEIEKAKNHIQIAVAWFTCLDLFNLLQKKILENVKVELIIINDFINNWNGLPFQSFIDN